MDACITPTIANRTELITDRDRAPFDVLLTAVAADSLLPQVSASDLPRFDDGPNWTVQPEARVSSGDYFDLAIVLCAQATHLAESASLVQDLVGRRISTVMLVPAALEHILPDVPEFLTVVAPGDLKQGIDVLAHILLAPVQQDGLVCCDWVDILAVLSDGARAQLVSAEGSSQSEAVRALAKGLVPLATGSGYGVLATIYLGATGGIRDWHSLRRVVNAAGRQDAIVLASAPIRKGSPSIAAAMVVTAPSSRYFRNASGSHAMD